MSKQATTNHPIHQLLVNRWSPYAYSDRDVSTADLQSLFEAARWAASSYNEQPWRFIVASKQNPKEFERALSCLVEANQSWAKFASALVLTATASKFERNDKENKAAEHDLGLAVANLSFEASARGISTHQMIGIDPQRVRELYHLPEDFAPLTAIAIGYSDPQGTHVAPEVAERDRTPRSRKNLNQIVFSGSWGIAAWAE